MLMADSNSVEVPLVAPIPIVRGWSDVLNNPLLTFNAIKRGTPIIYPGSGLPGEAAFHQVTTPGAAANSNGLTLYQRPGSASPLSTIYKAGAAYSPNLLVGPAISQNALSSFRSTLPEAYLNKERSDHVRANRTPAWIRRMKP